jgi:hypothetical protein
MRQIKVDINSEIFEQFNNDLNNALMECLNELYAENFEAGDISAKIAVELPEDMEIYPEINDNGDAVEKAYVFKKPSIDYKVTLTLKKRAEAKGAYKERLELQKDGDQFVLKEITGAQISLGEAGD